MAKTASRKNKKGLALEESPKLALANYALETSRPLHSLAFLLPLIIIYEVGILTVESIVQSQSQIVAFAWLQGFAEMIGMDESLAWAFPGFVVVIVLLCWHMASEYPWRIKPGWVLWMYLEAALLSLPLYLLNLLLGATRLYSNEAISETLEPYLGRVVMSIGAGIYEELIFRMIIMGLILVVLEDVFHVKISLAGQIAVWTSAVLFAAHHYVNYQDGHWILLETHTVKSFLLSFLFRTLSGAYFAFLFRYRGYGIIAGTHAAYNIILYSTLA